MRSLNAEKQGGVEPTSFTPFSLPAGLPDIIQGAAIILSPSRADKPPR
jgi:hypothetical protein